MKDIPFFKFDACDWLTGKVQVLSAEEKGIYIDLVARIWHNGGTIKRDKFLPRILHIDPDVLDVAISDFIELGIMEETQDGCISIKFLTEQVEEVAEYRKAQSCRAKGIKTSTAEPPQSDRLTTAEPPQSDRLTTAEPPQSDRLTTAEPPLSDRLATAEPPQSDRLATAEPPLSDRIANREIRKEKEDNIYISPQKSPPIFLDQTERNRIVDKLWQLYPKKTAIIPAKKAARDAIQKEFDKGKSLEDIGNHMITAVTAFSRAVERWGPKDRGFIWRMDTFFNDGHYYDDPKQWERSDEHERFGELH